MLPKFRPATVGGREAPVRPTIRPVKPVAPPPPPSPPRRQPSGVRRPEPHGPAIEDCENELSTASFEDPPTMTAARQRVHEIARELPSQYGGLPQFDDETQARAVDGELIMASRLRGEPLDVPYEALPSLEVERPFDEYEAQFAEHDPATQLHRDHNADSFSAAPVARRHVESGEQIRGARISDPPAPKYNTRPYAGAEDDSGARQRPRKDAALQYDPAAYEANYPGVRRAADREESYPQRNESYQAARRGESPRREESAPPIQPTRREGSYSNRSSARAPNEPSWPEPAPQIPAAPPVPHEMKVPAGFVMGVQPLRAGSVAAPMPVAATQIPEAFPPPQGHHQPRAQTPMMGVPQGQPQFAPTASPRAMHAPQHLHSRPTTNAPVYAHAHAIGHQVQVTDLEEAQHSSKVGRFAWFVFGAAFGIFFAFFATGFVPRIGKKEEIAFPPAAQLPQQQAPVAAAPPAQVPAPQQVAQAAPPAQVPAPQQVAQAPVAQPPAPPVTVAAAPVVPPVVAAPLAPPPVATAPVAAPAPAPQPVAEAKPAAPPRAATPAPAPAPRGQRAAAIARRPPPPPSNAPRALPNSGSVEADDDAPSTPRTASAPASGGSSSKRGGGSDISGISDLLSAGLGP